ncbi:MAG: hypothetical protein AMJ89_05510 [candidate division Zixibacteria bacterium SM23_73]|nr:MAG: hypothetical protein AMJ89_05510 [candidate division Zixibacteria bacterium SM23_73]
MTNKFFFSKAFWGFLLFLFFLLAYSLTLCPTVFWWDSGEFIANIAVLGIPHRPGFPIYILLGKFFSLPPFFNLALQINFLSALFSAFSLLVFYFAFFEILNLFFPRIAHKKTQATVSASAFLLVLGFTYSFWIQAVRAEVYSLSLLFFAVLLFSSLLYLKSCHLKYIYLFFFVLGLGLGNHHLSLLSTIPALFFLLLCSSPHNESVVRNSSFIINVRRLPLYLLFFLSGLSIYLYLPIRSISNPLLAWGDTQSLSGSASSVFALESLKNLNLNFLSNMGEKIFGTIYLFYDQLTLICFLISLLGMIFLAKHSKKFWIFLLLLIMGNCASVIFMTTEFISTNPDLHGYLLSSLFSLAFLYGLGVFFIMDGIKNHSSIIRHLSLVIFLLISFIPLSKHFTYANLSNNRIAHNYGYNTIHHLDSNSVLFVDNVNLSFILRELQYAEGTRRDVKIIERGLLSFNWYADQKRSEFGSTGKELKDLFSGIPDHLSGKALFYAILKKCLNQNTPTYMEFTEGDSDLVNYLIPSGYVFKLSEKRMDQIPEEILLSQKRWEKNGFFDLGDDKFQKDWDAKRVFALSFYRLGLFYEKRGMTSFALDKFEQVRKIDPHNKELLAKIKELRKDQRLSGMTNSDSSF